MAHDSPHPPHPKREPRAFLEHLYRVAVERAQPKRSLAAHLPEPPPRGRALVLGAGKAAGAMAHALELAWPAHAPLSGLVVTRYGHTPPRPHALLGVPPRIAIMEAAHPVPDAASEQAARRMLALAATAGANDLVLVLMSGGGSALLTLPVPGLTLADKQRIHRSLLASGADIATMNAVRKHLSAIKGGRLALACGPAQVLTLAISDVPGDDPGVIASGPTVPDASTCAEALAAIDRLGIELPVAVRAGLASGDLETPKPGDPRLARHTVRLIASPREALQAAAGAARACGLPAHLLGDDIEGESRDVAQVHAALARSVARHGEPFAPPCVLLSGGETTVTVGSATGSPGRGGRASEFALALALALRGEARVWALAADTDGIDGVSEAAGAFVGPDTLARAAAAGLDPAAHLARHDALGVFEPLGQALVTGPTQTNVNDFRALLIL